MTIFEKNVIKELLTATGLVVGNIDLDYDENIADILIDVNAVGIYSTSEIESVVKKISELESSLKKQGFIHDIKLGDLYMGNWRIRIHFLNEKEIEEFENKII